MPTAAAAVYASKERSKCRGIVRDKVSHTLSRDCTHSTTWVAKNVLYEQTNHFVDAHREIPRVASGILVGGAGQVTFFILSRQGCTEMKNTKIFTAEHCRVTIVRAPKLLITLDGLTKLNQILGCSEKQTRAKNSTKT